jgi:hypothetical protein
MYFVFILAYVFHHLLTCIQTDLCISSFFHRPQASTDGTIEKQFVELTSVPALTDTERWKVLDVRDRLLKACENLFSLLATV